nr:MAG TPA: hypothetical protein [Caudoviricetes sp.]
MICSKFTSFFIEAEFSLEVCSFINQKYLPKSTSRPCPDVIYQIEL